MKIFVENQKSLSFDVDGNLILNVAIAGRKFRIDMSDDYTEGYLISEPVDTESGEFTELDKNKFGEYSRAWKFLYMTLPTAVVVFQTGGAMDDRSFYKVKRYEDSMIFKLKENYYLDNFTNKFVEKE